MTQRRTRSWTSTVDVLALHELTDDDRTLLEAAHDAAKHAYAPYSGFHVGGAVRLACGTIVKGSNQENMAYPSGMCGERVAVFAAGGRKALEDYSSQAGGAAKQITNQMP